MEARLTAEDVTRPAEWVEQLMLQLFAALFSAECDFGQKRGERNRIAGRNVVVQQVPDLLDSWRFSESEMFSPCGYVLCSDLRKQTMRSTSWYPKAT
jgi:hypothetical protein